MSNAKDTPSQNRCVPDRSTVETTRVIRAESERVDAFRYEGDIDLGAALVKRIAALDGVDPTEIDGTLHDVICADAIECLLAGRHGEGVESGLRLTFRAFGYGVEILGDGRIALYELPNGSPRTA